MGLGTRPLRSLTAAPLRLSLAGLPEECAIDAEERVLSASSHLPLVTLTSQLAEQGLLLPPLLTPDGVSPDGTLAGLYADPRESPLVARLGRVRDHVLGIEGVRGDGTRFKAGGRVVKNVTGYDLTRFLCGARGRHAVITRLHWRLQARPEALVVARIPGDDLADAWRKLLPLRALPMDPLLVTLRPPGELCIAECGPSRVVDAHLERALTAVGHASATCTTATPEDWQQLVAQPAPRGDALLLRVHAPFSRWGELLGGDLALHRTHPIEWHAIFPAAHFALAWLITDPEPLATEPQASDPLATIAALNATLTQYGGSVQPERLPRNAGSEWEAAWAMPAPPSAGELFRRWDPAGVLE